MSIFVPDTSCMVAAVCTWHEQHEPVVAEIEGRFNRGETMRVAAPALIEAYAVLTRLPPPHRLSSADALTLVEANFIRAAHIIALNGHVYHTLLRRARDDGIRGGQIYDAVIAECALQAHASVLLTFNKNHFLPFAERGLTIVLPGESTL